MVDWTKLDGYLMDYRRCYIMQDIDEVSTSTGFTPAVVHDEHGNPIPLAFATREQIEQYMPHLLTMTVECK